jgi:hypothetical protein
MVSLLGWIGNFCFAVCGAPEAYRSYKNKKCNVGWELLILWLVGEIFTPIYVILQNGFINSVPLLFNYATNILFLYVMFFYKISHLKLAKEALR